MTFSSFYKNFHTIVGKLKVLLRQVKTFLVSEDVDVHQIEVRNVHTHRSTGTVTNGLGLGRVHDNFLNSLQHLVGDCSQTLSVLDKFDQLAVLIVVIDQSDHLWKVVAVPLTDTHSKGVDILVQLIDQSNGYKINNL